MAPKKTHQKILYTGAGWGVSLILFFPIFWMIHTSFKTELEAFSMPPSFFFDATFENYGIVQERSNYFHFAMNSIILSFGSTLLGLLVAIPAAWAMAFKPSKRTRGTLLWILSTKMMPPVGVLVPLYLLFRDLNLLDTRIGLTLVLMMINLPIIIWMLYTYFKEVPHALLEAARLDGTNMVQEIVYVLIPTTFGGIASTFLLSVIFAWNEAFWTLNLAASDAAPLTAFIASYSSPEGLFWAKLSAASTMAVAPILIFGWFSQRQLVQGMTFGAVK